MLVTKDERGIECWRDLPQGEIADKEAGMSDESRLAFESLKADEVGRRLKSVSERYEVAAKVVTSEEGREYVSVRVWMGSESPTGEGWREPSTWSHTVYDEDQNIVAYGFGDRERDSWAVAQRVLGKKLGEVARDSRGPKEPSLGPAKKDPRGSGETSVATFVEDDAGYKHWLDANPHGFVLNVNAAPSADWILHCATCRTISGDPSHGNTWTYRPWTKACADDSRVLEAWAQTQERDGLKGVFIRYCNVCYPAIVREG